MIESVGCSLIQCLDSYKACQSLVILSNDASNQSTWKCNYFCIYYQSEAVVEVYKRDLNEFVQTVAAEGSQGVDILTRGFQTLASGEVNQDTEKKTNLNASSPETVLLSSSTVLDTSTASNDPVGDAAGSDCIESASHVNDESHPQASTKDVLDTEKQDTGKSKPELQPIKTDFTEAAEEGLLDKLDAIAEQAENYVGHRLTELGSGLANGFSSLLGTVTHAAPDSASLGRSTHSSTLNPIPPAHLKYDRVQEMVDEMAKDPSTYTTDPRDLVQVKSHLASSKLLTSDSETYAMRFAQFESTFDRISKAGQIAVLMSNRSHVKHYYDTIVPRVVSDSDFWTRYYFRVSEIEREDAARRQLLDHAAAGEATEDDFNWDSDDNEVESDNAKSTSPNPVAQNKPTVASSVVSPVVACLESLTDSTDMSRLNTESTLQSNAPPSHNDTNLVKHIECIPKDTLSVVSTEQPAASSNVSIVSTSIAIGSEDHSSDSFELVRELSSYTASCKPHEDTDSDTGDNIASDTMTDTHHTPLVTHKTSDDKGDWGDWE
ncbi:BSD domain-containing protein 1 [Batrachochytrium dendrobatidis]